MKKKQITPLKEIIQEVLILRQDPQFVKGVQQFIKTIVDNINFRMF